MLILSRDCLEVKKLDKEHLRAEFSKNYHSYYSTELFKREGFSRKKCRICGKHFWSIGDRDKCDDPEHTPYSFFRERPAKMDYAGMWIKFADFFKKKGHTIIPRYPVVSRWRNDLYFTIASIQDFQRIENGKMSFEYNANPLVVPQICLRFGDIENVGITGRHLTSFMMAGQHAFDWPKHGYWRDETMDLNYEFLTSMLKVKKENLVYSEDVWAMGDFSEFGPCLESFSNGLELVNSVFTQFESQDGKVKELEGKVVDVGWGFERLLWFYTGYDNIYEATFSSILERIEKQSHLNFDKKMFRNFAKLSSELDVTEKGGYSKEMEVVKKAGISVEDYNKKVKPLQALYAVLDHTRTLLFAISDGSMPSNIGGGYNLRVILRRSLGFINEYSLGITVPEIASMQAQELRSMYPELLDNLDVIEKVVSVEEDRYKKMQDNAARVVIALLSKKKKLDAGELRTLYESNGVTPELINTIAAQKGQKVEMPQSNYKDIIQGDFAAKEKGRKIDIDVDGIKKTEQSYYDFAAKGTAKVLLAQKNYVVLDRSVFYPEGGGQAAERGIIEGVEVRDVQKVGDVIVHIMQSDISKSEKFKNGAIVTCAVNMERRNRLMVHHTATHLMSAAARSVLGKHAWQEGTRKEEDKAHIDVVHYEKLDKKNVEDMEDFVNYALFNGIKVEAVEMDRKEAEGRFGFAIYQGHGVPSKKMRMVIITDRDGKVIDAEACGGMHVIGREGMMGVVKIIGTCRIHDGVDRIEYVAGPAAMEYFDREDDELSAIAQAFNTEKFATSVKVHGLRESYSKMHKELDSLSEIASDALADIHEKSGKKEIVLDVGHGDRKLMRKTAEKITNRAKDALVCITNKSLEVVCVSGDASKVSAVEYLRKKFAGKFRGGGSDKVAEGRIE